MDSQLKEIVGDMFRFSRKFGIHEALWGVDYQRTLEYAVSVKTIQGEPSKALDIGTGKHSIFALYLADRYGAHVTITDVRTSAIERQRRIAGRYKGSFNKEPAFEVADARSLQLKDGEFDLVTAISAVEHIEEDSKAMKEIARVLKVGGRALLTVPFSPEGHHDSMRERSSYTIAYNGAPVFFEHEYDKSSLASRLIEPSGLSVVNIQYLGEPGWSYRNFFVDYVPLRNATKYLLGWANEFLAKRFEGIVEENRGQIAAVTLEKR